MSKDLDNESIMGKRPWDKKYNDKEQAYRLEPMGLGPHIGPKHPHAEVREYTLVSNVKTYREQRLTEPKWVKKDKEKRKMKERVFHLYN